MSEAADVIEGEMSRTMVAWVPPFRKKSCTAKLMGLLIHRPPNVRSKSLKLLTVVGVLTGPRNARPTKAVMKVATPVMARTPLGIPWM